MATEKLYDHDSHLCRTAARVRDCRPEGKEWWITLDRTVFYPTGGGQPCDRGSIGSAAVLDVQERGGEVAHLCDRPLEPGEAVDCEIDWARRLDLMQQHSGEHIVSGLIHSRFGFDNVGFHMGSDVVTIDFNGEIDRPALEALEQAANEAVWRNLPVRTWFPPAEELAGLPYRSKKTLSGAVRLVEIPDVDLCACCGTHVQRTGEIGLIKLFGATRFHGGSRLEMACGGRALALLNRLCAQNREISGCLSAKPVETAAAVRRLQEERNALQQELVRLEQRLFDLRARSLRGDVLLFEEAMPGDRLRRLTDTVLRRCGGRCAVFAGTDGAYQYAIGVPEGDLRPLAKRLNDSLQGRGGGRPGFVQGSVAAARAEIEAFFAQEAGMR